jgi:hypothetical protein
VTPYDESAESVIATPMLFWFFLHWTEASRVGAGKMPFRAQGKPALPVLGGADDGTDS